MVMLAKLKRHCTQSWLITIYDRVFILLISLPLIMANVLKVDEVFQITIPNTQEVNNNYVTYEIKVQVGDLYWTVYHRFKEFVTLHENLVKDHGVANDILPPKKVIGNKEPSFIAKRKQSLEIYINTVVRYLQKTMPDDLVNFLLIDKYDISYIVKNLAAQFYHEGETLLQKSKCYSFSPLQLYAISERCKQPCPSIETTHDFSHVLDFCSQLIDLTVTGSAESLPKSNLILNDLSFDLNVFKSLERLNLVNLNCAKITNLGVIRASVKHLQATGCTLKQISDLLLCDQMHRTILDKSLEWAKLTNINCSDNQLVEIDESIKLSPNLQIFNAENNSLRLDELDHLTRLTHLMQLHFSCNSINFSPNQELVFQRLMHLDLSQNRIKYLKPFEKLHKIHTLDLRSNQIDDIEEITYLIKLPCLENVVLTGNPVSTIVDYRVKVLEYFGNRAYEVCLDNESTSRKELDKVAIFLALKSSNVC